MTLTAPIKAFAKLLLFGGMSFLCAQSYAQLLIPEHALLRLDEDLVTQEEYNYINTSIMGTAKLVFNAGQPQILLATQSIRLPQLAVSNPVSFTSYASLTVQGNASFHTPLLSLHSLMLVNGELYVTADTFISGLDYLINNTLHRYKAGNTAHIFSGPWAKNLKLGENEYVLQNPISTHSIVFYYTDKTNKQVYLSIPKPPPERYS